MSTSPRRYGAMAIVVAAACSDRSLERLETDAGGDQQRPSTGDTPVTIDPAATGDAGTAEEGLGPSTFPGGSRRTWVHEMVQMPPVELPDRPYGADYPLSMRAYSAPPRPEENAQRYLDSGINGVQLLFFDSDVDVQSRALRRFALFDNTDVAFAPCIYPQGGIERAVEILRDYVTAAEGHPSAARLAVEGELRWVVFVYGTRYKLAPSSVAELRSAARAAGLPIYLVGDVVSSISYNRGSFDSNRVESFAKASIAAYLPQLDASWTFDSGVDMAWAPLVSAVRANGKLFAGGMMPEYNRESITTGGYVDAEGTARYRRQWNDAIASDLGWNTVVSWNDFSEHHEIEPTTAWSWTRADITAFYSAKFRGAPPPAYLAQPQLYVTTPERINLGGAARTVEALVLNGGKNTVRLTLELRDGADTPIERATSADVGPGIAGAVVLPFARTKFPASRFVRAVATTTEQDGAIVQSVKSAPIVVYGTDEQATGFAFTRTKYRSVAARLVLPGSVAIALSGSPTNGKATAMVTPPAGVSVRFTDVLQNGFQVASPFTPPRTAVPIPLKNGTKIMDQTIVDTPASGFYVGRVIDERERIGYSDPVYVAP